MRVILNGEHAGELQQGCMNWHYVSWIAVNCVNCPTGMIFVAIQFMERSENSWRSQFMMRQHQFIKNKQSKNRRKFILLLLLFFLFCRYIHFREIYSLSWNMFTKDELDMLSLRSSSIYCRSAPIRYEINPFRFWHISPLARNAKAYRVRQHISSCVSNISKIPQGIYLDAWCP